MCYQLYISIKYMLTLWNWCSLMYSCFCIFYYIWCS